jgi:hypothetical protein
MRTHVAFNTDEVFAECKATRREVRSVPRPFWGDAADGNLAKRLPLADSVIDAFDDHDATK